MQVQSLGGKTACRRTWQPTPVFLPGDSHGHRSLAGYNLRGRRVGYCTSSGPGTENKNSFFLILVWLPSEMQVVSLNICILPTKAVKPVEIQISV